MGLEIYDLKLLTELRRQYPHGSAVAMLGDCYFHFTNRELFATTNRPENELMPSDNLANLITFAQALNFNIAETLDIQGNPTIKLDLHSALPEELKGRFDWVIDAGTLFWCFDVASVWRNILDMLKDGGYVFHIAALTGHFGRGYYNFHPRLFRDFYRQNGFEIITMGYRTKVRGRAFNNRITSKLEEIYRMITGVAEYGQWELFAADRIYLEKASKHILQFTSTPPDSVPVLIPDDVVIMCFAHRNKRSDYKLPILG